MPSRQPCWGGLVINGFQGGYRLYLNDSYVFNREIAVNYEHSLCGGIKKGQKTDCIVWYYLRDPAQCNLRLTDELDVGDAASEKAHQYAVSQADLVGQDRQRLRGLRTGRSVSRDGSGAGLYRQEHFTIKIDPHNQGVKLRRRLNRQFGQRATGQGLRGRREIADTPWYFCDLPAPAETAFADTDFEIPAAYTQGKAQISITLEHVKAGHGRPATQVIDAAKAAACGQSRRCPRIGRLQ